MTIGSRTADKAQATAEEIGAAGAGENAAVASGKDIVIVTVPYASQADTLKQIAPHGRQRRSSSIPPCRWCRPRSCASSFPPPAAPRSRRARTSARTCGCVTAFHNVAAHILDTDAKVECDVLVFSDDVEARQTIVDLLHRTWSCAAFRAARWSTRPRPRR